MWAWRLSYTIFYFLLIYLFNLTKHKYTRLGYTDC